MGGRGFTNRIEAISNFLFLNGPVKEMYPDLVGKYEGKLMGDDRKIGN